MVQARSRVAACQEQSRTVGMDSHVGPDALARCCAVSTLHSIPSETGSHCRLSEQSDGLLTMYQSDEDRGTLEGSLT